MKLASLIYVAILIKASAQESIAFRVPFTEAEQAKIGEEVVKHPNLSRLASQGRIRVLSVKPYIGGKNESLEETNLAEITVISYSDGQAYRVLYNPAARRILSQVQLSGTPQPSQEEINEALGLIRSDPDHAKLLSSGNVLEGGFAVGGPPHSPLRDRFVQIQMLSPDRKNFVRIITVDLTARKIVESVPKH